MPASKNRDDKKMEEDERLADHMLDFLLLSWIARNISSLVLLTAIKGVCF